jgi:hypothetical protein
MGFFKNIFSKTLTYKFYNCFATLVQYIKDYNIVAESLYSEAFSKVLLRYLNKDFKKDWIGRLYAVINPNIDINGKLNFNNTVIELDDQRTNNQAYVENWIYKQMGLLADMFKLQNMYTYISVGIEHVGPENADNFLVIFDITARQDWTNALKKFLKHLFAYSIIGASIFAMIHFNIL